jgi:hypothetical protein
MLAVVLMFAVAMPAWAKQPPGRADPAAVTGLDREHVRGLLAKGSYDELEALYAGTSTAYRRNDAGKLHTEIFRTHLIYGRGDPERAEADLRIQDWVRRFPDSVIAAIVRAQLSVERAQEIAEGNDWASIDRLSAEAYEALMMVKAKGRDDANWHTLLFLVADLQGWSLERLKPAIEAAVDADPYAIRPYIAAAAALATATHRDPKWLAWLADLAVAKTQGTEGSSMYARVYLEGGASWFRIGARPFSSGHMDWSRLHASLDDWYARLPNPAVKVGHAALACLVRDAPVAEALMDAIGPDPDLSVFERHGGRALYPRCKSWLNEEKAIPSPARARLTAALTPRCRDAYHRSGFATGGTGFMKANLNAPGGRLSALASTGSG